MCSNPTPYKPISGKHRNLISDALEIEAESAMDAGKIGYMARILTWTTLPHRDPKMPFFERKNGEFRVRITDSAGFGMPFGSYPRLILAWMTTEASISKSRTLRMGDTLAEFMRSLGLRTSGAAEKALKMQAARLFGSTITCTSETRERYSGTNLAVAKSWDVWWRPDGEFKGRFPFDVTLTEEFYSEIVDRPVPIDFRALVALKRSPLSMDIYIWLTYRMSYLKRPTKISWLQLQSQFGANYATNENGTKNFQRKFQQSLKDVLVVYPEAKVRCLRGRLSLKPSSPHIPKRLSTKPVNSQSYPR